MLSPELEGPVLSTSADHTPSTTHERQEQDQLTSPATHDAAGFLERGDSLPQSAGQPLTPTSLPGDSTAPAASKTDDVKDRPPSRDGPVPEANRPGSSRENPVVLNESAVASPVKHRPSPLGGLAKKKKSSFLQDALAATALYVETPRQKEFAVVQQTEAHEPAIVLKPKATDEEETASVPAPKKRRFKTSKPKISAEARKLEDEARKAKLNLDAQKLAKQLQEAIPTEVHDHFAEFAQLLKDSADPTVDTRDPNPEPAPLPSTEEKKSKKRTRKKKEENAEKSEQPKKRQRRSAKGN